MICNSSYPTVSHHIQSFASSRNQELATQVSAQVFAQVFVNSAFALINQSPLFNNPVGTSCFKASANPNSDENDSHQEVDRIAIDHLIEIDDDETIRTEIVDDKDKELPTLVMSAEEFKRKLLDNTLPMNQKIQVNENLILYNLPESTTLPDNLSVSGDLSLESCTALTALPENLSVGGDLTIHSCTALTALPQNLSISGNLTIHSCTALTALPDNLSISGNLTIRSCTALTALPDNLSVGGDLTLSGCNILTSLPHNLSVGGNLWLNNCTALTTINENLSVCGDMFLTSTALTALPDNISVGRYLDLDNCTGLSTLPDNLSFGGDLDLSGCTGLTSLPNSITGWGPCSDGSIREIDLTGTGLSDAVLRRLQASEAPGIQFYVSQRDSEPTKRFASIREGLQFWANLAQDNNIPELTFDEYSNEILRFLSRLTSTKEYDNSHSRSFLAKRVMDMFKVMSEDSEVKEKAVDSIYHALSTCDDRIISAFNEIELMIEVHKIEKGSFSEADLKDLGKRFLMLEMVNEKAKEHVQSLRFVDEIEVYLAFQIGLAERFNLPIKTRNMIFRGCADITDDKIQQFGDQIKAACTDEKVEAYLQTWSPWIKYKRESQIPPYDTLPIDTDTKSVENPICVISQDKPKQAVSYEGNIYDYEMFIGHYKANEKNPMNPSEAIDISKLKRVT